MTATEIIQGLADLSDEDLDLLAGAVDEEIEERESDDDLSDEDEDEEDEEPE